MAHGVLPAEGDEDEAEAEVDKPGLGVDQLRGRIREGVRGADRAIPALAGSLYETEDLKRAVESFLAEGPGKFSDFKGE